MTDRHMYPGNIIDDSHVSIKKIDSPQRFDKTHLLTLSKKNSATTSVDPLKVTTFSVAELWAVEG